MHLVSTLCTIFTPPVLIKLSPLATVSLPPSLRLKEKRQCVLSCVGLDPEHHLKESVSGNSPKHTPPWPQRLSPGLGDSHLQLLRLDWVPICSKTAFQRTRNIPKCVRKRESPHLLKEMTGKPGSSTYQLRFNT